MEAIGEKVDGRTIVGKLQEKIGELQEKIGELENRVQLLEIIAKGESKIPSEPQPLTKKVRQINTYTQEKVVDGKTYNSGAGKTYYCETVQEEHIFAINNPGVKTEGFTIEMETFTANELLNDPENKKQFVKKE